MFFLLLYIDSIIFIFVVIYHAALGFPVIGDATPKEDSPFSSSKVKYVIGFMACFAFFVYCV